LHLNAVSGVANNISRQTSAQNSSQPTLAVHRQSEQAAYLMPDYPSAAIMPQAFLNNPFTYLQQHQLPSHEMGDDNLTLHHQAMLYQQQQLYIQQQQLLSAAAAAFAGIQMPVYYPQHAPVEASQGTFPNPQLALLFQQPAYLQQYTHPSHSSESSSFPSAQHEVVQSPVQSNFVSATPAVRSDNTLKLTAASRKTIKAKPKKDKPKRPLSAYNL
jgi:hypothetical protein